MPRTHCENCGDEIGPHGENYCSQECFHEGHSFEGKNNPNYKGGKTLAKCQICGCEFEYYPSEKEGLYCGDCVENQSWQTPPGVSGPDHPRWKEKVERDCAVCKATIRRTPGMFTSEVALCSKKCHSTWLSESFTGEGHPNWKGGGPGNYGPGWAAIRRKALERDGYACVICGTDAETLGRNPDVHHIIPVRFFVKSDSHDKTDAHTMDNVVSLCVGCHRKADFGNIPAATLRSAIATAQGSDSSAETVHSR